MDAYDAPVADMMAALRLAGLDELLALPAFAGAHADAETVETLVGEFGRLASEVIAPTDRVGDTVGSKLDVTTGDVTAPPGFTAAYRQYVDGGWAALAVPAEHGGGGFPTVVGLAVQELFTTANLALSLNPMLTHAAVELLARWGDQRQRSVFLPKLLTGEWCGTMDLTEPDAGSDVGALRTRAEQDAGGVWRLTGSKIFITWGEHDMAGNIVHMVLARTPGSAPGTKGLSLFAVPKFLVNDDGSLGARNAMRAAKLEEKVGIHASPTCVMEFDGAVGELVGEEHAGMRGMFTMMNAARVSIGLQGLAVAERAWQQSLAYARERRQGRAAGAPASAGRAAIIEHPDVQRMLLTMRVSSLAMRHLLYLTAAQSDVASAHPDEAVRARAAALSELLTPVAKAWPTDLGVAAASLGVQVHGGMGYVEETGIAQRWRDSRIGPIYEGTNGIQAIDLIGRKLLRDDGKAMRALIAEIKATSDAGLSNAVQAL
ncbi:MAG TPA: acyl-CoA dehydrogenase family protein, partial [Acidimicrobiales bacterium]|nr:acyl-CoA dehydrogenase family protein [Acidimicrobiales bacterium]